MRLTPLIRVQKHATQVRITNEKSQESHREIVMSLFRSNFVKRQNATLKDVSMCLLSNDLQKY